MKKFFAYRLAALVLCAAALSTQPALAQNAAVQFPGKTVTIVVPLPTARELGFNFEATQVWAMLVPVKTPPALIRVLNEKAAAAINNPEIRQRLEKMGYIVDPGQPEALAARLAAQARTLERAASDA